MKLLNWKVVVLAVTAMICGTAIYVFHGVQMAQQKRPALPDFGSLKPVTSPALAGSKNSPTVDELLDSVHVVAPPAIPDFKTLVPVKADRSASRFIPPKPSDLDLVSRPQNNLAAALRQNSYELQRANDIAEQAQQQWRRDSLQARMEALDRQSTLDNIEFDLEFQQLQSAFPQQNDWTLKYNGFDNTWRYAPMNSTLMYSPFGNNWEFVPQN